MDISYEKLCADLRLRGHAATIFQQERGAIWGTLDAVLLEAADVIEALQAESEKLKEQMAAAVNDITEMAHTDGRIWACLYCKHALSIVRGFADCERGGDCKRGGTLFEWRGVREAEAALEARTGSD